MVQLLLPIIYISFISLGLPDSLLGSAWPSMYPALGVPVSYAGLISMIISFGTIVSSLNSDRLTRALGTGKVTALSVAMTAAALFGFSVSTQFWMLCLWAIPYGLGAGAVDATVSGLGAQAHLSLLAALTSTLSAILNSTSTLFTMDFYAKIDKRADERKLVRVGKLASLVIIVIAALWAPQIGRFGSLLKYYQEMLSYIAPPVVAAFLMGVFSRRANGRGAFAGLIAGLVVAAAMLLWRTEIFGGMHFLLIVPFWTSFLIRTYAWIFILSGKGIPALLASLGLEDVRLINTPWAVLIGIVYGYLPLMVFPIYVSLEKLDKAAAGSVDPDTTNKVLIPKIIRERYPDLDESQVEELRQQVVVDSVIKNGEVREVGDELGPYRALTVIRSVR